MKLAQRLQDVKQRILDQTVIAKRSAGTISLLAVSKKHPVAKIDEAYQCGQKDFGENYLQEALEKIEALKYKDLVWHFIGPIQSNKTRAISEHFDWVHTVDRLKIAQRLSDQRPQNFDPINVCIQVNIDDEASKSGILKNEALTLARAISDLPNIKLRGLMAIPKAINEGDDASFRQMHDLFEHLAGLNEFPDWDTLSMGMSADLEQAIANGANIVRIGTDIFGPRN